MTLHHLEVQDGRGHHRWAHDLGGWYWAHGIIRLDWVDNLEDQVLAMIEIMLLLLLRLLLKLDMWLGLLVWV